MGKTWDNEFETCDCKNRHCGCSGGRMSLAGPYQRVLRVVKPRYVYEWGPGFSTGIAIGFCIPVIAVEHDKKYIPNIPFNDQLHCIHAKMQSEQYVEPQTDAELFLVDGRRRAECIRRVLRRYTDGTEKPFSPVLCLHDAQRTRYHKALREWPHVRFLARGFAVAALEPYRIAGIDKGEAIDGIRKEQTPLGG